MTIFLILLGVLSIAGAVATIRDIARDGHRRIRTRP
jgi:hypothetical protein